MIVGSFSVAVDAQGRLIVPSAWHPDLGEGVVIVRDLSASKKPFLTALTKEAFESTINDFSHTLATDDRYSDATRNLLQFACGCKFDQKRRITIDQENLKYAGITTNAMLTANIRSNKPVFEIWAPETLKANNEDFDTWKSKALFKKNAEEVRNLQ